jgi:hypothetical protein
LGEDLLQAECLSSQVLVLTGDQINQALVAGPAFVAQELKPDVAAT